MIFNNFEEFESILDKLFDNEQYEVADGIMIKSSDLAKYEEKCPANRWY